MTKTEPSARTRLILSFAGLLLGSLLLRAAAGAMGENIQFYFNAINDAARDPNHPLRTLVHANVYPISYALGGAIIATFFAAELLGALVLGSLSDRYGRKPFIVLGPLFGAVAVQITALTTSLFILVITRLLEACLLPPAPRPRWPTSPTSPRTIPRCARGWWASLKWSPSPAWPPALRWGAGCGAPSARRPSSLACRSPVRRLRSMPCSTWSAC